MKPDDVAWGSLWTLMASESVRLEYLEGYYTSSNGPTWLRATRNDGIRPVSYSV